MKKSIPLTTPEVFDAVVRGPVKPPHLWGAQAIAAAAGVSAETVRRTWAPDPACPIRKCGGRLYAVRDELLAWIAGR